MEYDFTSQYMQKDRNEEKSRLPEGWKWFHFDGFIHLYDPDQVEHFSYNPIKEEFKISAGYHCDSKDLKNLSREDFMKLAETLVLKKLEEQKSRPPMEGIGRWRKDVRGLNEELLELAGTSDMERFAGRLVIYMNYKKTFYEHSPVKCAPFTNYQELGMEERMEYDDEYINYKEYMKTYEMTIETLEHMLAEATLESLGWHKENSESLCTSWTKEEPVRIRHKQR